MQQADLSRWIAEATVGRVVVEHRGQALKTVRAITFEALLFAECGYDPPRSLMPVLVQWFSVAGSAPVLIGKAYGITERVDFPFAFMHARAHLGQVRDERARLIGCVECVGVGIQADAVCLPVNEPLKQGLKLPLFWRKMHVWQHLSRGIPQPHRGDVSSDDKRIRFAVPLRKLHGCVERVWIAVFKETCQSRISDSALDVDDCVLDGVADKCALSNRRATCRCKAG